jgi:hypothetical protein
MLILTAATNDEVETVRLAWAEGRLDECLGGVPFSVWLGDCYRFGSEGTEPAPEARPAGRHRLGAARHPPPRPEEGASQPGRASG